MARISRCLVVAVFVVLCLGIPAARCADDAEDDEYGDAERALLVVRKTVAEDLAVQGRNVTVHLDIFNAGSSSAADVQLHDTLPAEASLLEGSLTTSFRRVAAGSHAKHSYVIVFNEGKVGAQLPPAKVTYRPDTESTETQIGLSSVAELHVLTPVQQITRYALMAGRWASLGLATTTTDWRNIAIAVVLIGGLLGGNVGYKAFNSNQTTRKRARALRELEH